MQPINYHHIYVQDLQIEHISKNIQLSILRTDAIHSIISGNKWFKLQLQLKDAVQKGFTHIGTFGGAYSNHLVATAYACQMQQLKSIGIVRGEPTNPPSHTLQDAQKFSMQLNHVERSTYKNKEAIKEQYLEQDSAIYWINEGGYSHLGAAGAQLMTQWIPDTATHIVCAVGTGTMMAGLIKGALPHQQVIGISALKGHWELHNDVLALLTAAEKQKKIHVIHDYHFGGYAKCNPKLIDWMNHLYRLYQLPTDRVYTSKMMYGLFQLLEQGYFAPGSRIVAIHSGGLQGNLSLPVGELLF